VPDIYNGDELPFFALVDPDNRRPVDWDRRRELLARVQSGAKPDDETRKLWLVERLLALRARRPDAFEGSYEPIEAGETVCAYMRGGDVLVAVAVREGWDRSALAPPPGYWRDALGGAALASHGIAVLERDGR
jgi:(1->4)-alpha-D-glucan 1-alpha-D-glucosylmutase